MEANDNMDLYPHQRELLALNPDKYLLAHGTGAGKTLMAMLLADNRKEATLVICPKHLKEKWQRDMKDFKHPWLVVSKEEFKKLHRTLKRYPTVIVDEAHTFAGITSQLYKSLVWYFRTWVIPYRYLLTATPYLSTPWNIYALGVLYGLPLNYQKFRATFFAEIMMGRRHVWKAREGKAYRDALNKIVNTIGSSVQLDDVFDVPAQKHEVVKLDLTPEQEKALNDTYDPVPIVRWTRIHQVENGVHFNDFDKLIYPIDVKTQWILEFAKTHKKFVIFVRYIDQLNFIGAELHKMRVPILKIKGDIKNRDSVIQEANSLKNVVLLVQAQCSEGYELPTFDTVVYASMSFSYKDLVQSQGRVLRANALHENEYYYLVIDSGVDEEVYKSLQKKEDFSFEILERR